MAKIAHWFKHDADAIDDPKMMEIIMNHGMEGYGTFFAIIGILTRQQQYRYPIDKISMLARRLFMEPEKLEKMMGSFFDSQLLVKNNGFFCSERHLKDMGVLKSRKNSGSKGAEARWKNKGNGKSDGKTHGEHDNKIYGKSDGMRGDKKREEEIYKENLKEKNILLLRESTQMKESVCMLNKIKPEKCNELLEIFITRISGTDEIYRPPTENKKHFTNWVPEYLKLPMLNKALNQSSPPITPRKSVAE